MNNHCDHLAPNFNYKTVPWKDLVVHYRFETMRELCLPLPWLVGAFYCGLQGWTVGMGVCVVYVFMLGLRVAHNSFHGTLGLSRWGDHLVMFTISFIMLGSSHAINYTHMYHHKHCMQKGDIEGELATLSFFRALLKSPIYPIYIHIAALRDAPWAQKRWVMAELVVSLLMQSVIWVWFESPVFMLYTLMMVAANVLAPMVGIWGVHHDCEHAPTNARSCRSALLNFLTCGMFYHAEHHLFPAVPTRHLGELAARIDAAKAPAFFEVTDFSSPSASMVYRD